MSLPGRYYSCNTSGIKQTGGGVSGYRHGSIGSIGPQGDPAWLSAYALQYIDQTPMFKPLQGNTHLATPSAGIVVEGIFYLNKSQIDCMCQKNRIKLYKKNERGDLIPYTRNELIEKLKRKGGRTAY